ncbi:MAG: hypothetical protein IJ733_01010 [Lachnospiraceae bacterium]|nr:hypothetical protein [Lachnospiraceae bacterium]
MKIVKMEPTELTEQEIEEMNQKLSDEELDKVSGGLIYDGYYIFSEEDIEKFAEAWGNHWRQLKPGKKYTRDYFNFYGFWGLGKTPVSTSNPLYNLSSKSQRLFALKELKRMGIQVEVAGYEDYIKAL